MRFFRVVMLAAGLLPVALVHAQTADEIINKYIETLGGKDKVSSIKSVYTEYDMEVMGQQAPGTTTIVNGKGYKNEVDFAGQKIVQCFTDKDGWGLNPMMGQTAPTAMPAEVVKLSQGQLDVAPLMNYAAKGSTVELLGKDTLSGKPAYKLKLKDKAGTESMFWIDLATNYMVKTSVKATLDGAEIETSVIFSNYKKTDSGFLMPYSSAITLPQGIGLNVTSKKIEINKEIDMKVFEMPKQ